MSFFPISSNFEHRQVILMRKVPISPRDYGSILDLIKRSVLHLSKDKFINLRNLISLNYETYGSVKISKLDSTVNSNFVNDKKRKSFVKVSLKTIF